MNVPLAALGREMTEKESAEATLGLLLKTQVD